MSTFLFNLTLFIYYSNKYNIKTIGNPTLQDGKIYNITTSNYGMFPEYFHPSNKIPWYILFKFNATNVSTQQNIFGNDKGGGGFSGINLRIKNNCLQCLLSSGTSDWTIANKTGATTLVNGTTYYAKITFDGTNKYEWLLREPTGQYISQATATSTAQLISYTGTIGVDYHGSNKVFQIPFLSWIDLGECYIFYNNVLWWFGTDKILV